MVVSKFFPSYAAKWKPAVVTNRQTVLGVELHLRETGNLYSVFENCV